MGMPDSWGARIAMSQQVKPAYEDLIRKVQKLTWISTSPSSPNIFTGLE